MLSVQMLDEFCPSGSVVLVAMSLIRRFLNQFSSRPGQIQRSAASVIQPSRKRHPRRCRPEAALPQPKGLTVPGHHARCTLCVPACQKGPLPTKPGARRESVSG